MDYIQLHGTFFFLFVLLKKSAIGISTFFNNLYSIIINLKQVFQLYLVENLLVCTFQFNINIK